MLTKRKIVFTVVTLVLMILVLFIFFYFEKTKIVNIPKEEIKKVLSDPKNNDRCKTITDQSAYESGIKTNDKSICECIKNLDLKDKCISVASDSDLYNDGITNLDINYCNKIQNINTKSSCLSAVKNGQDYNKTREHKIKNANKMTLDDYEKERIKNPDNYSNLINLAMIYKAKIYGNKEGEFNKDMVNKTIEVLTEANKIAPNNSMIYLQYCELYIITKDNTKAIENCKKIISLDNDKELIAKASKLLDTLQK